MSAADAGDVDDVDDDLGIEINPADHGEIKQAEPTKASRWRKPLAELGNDVAYVIMRLIRVVLGFAFGAGCIAGMFVEGCSVLGFCFSFGSPSQMAMLSPRTLFWTHYWLPMAVVGIVVPVMLYSLKVAIGIPYRYKSGKPGLNVRHCEWCRGMTLDTMVCGKCGLPRVIWVASSIVWVVSLAVTLLWVVHDALGYLLFFASL